MERVNEFSFVGNSASYKYEIGVDKKIEQFKYVNGTIHRSLKNKVRKDTLINYKTVAIPRAVNSSNTWTLCKQMKKF